MAALGTNAKAQIVSGSYKDLTQGTILPDFAPRFSADGSVIAFTNSTYTGTTNNLPAIRGNDVWTMKPDGTARGRLSGGPHENNAEEWGSPSPNGRYVVMHQFCGNPLNSAGNGSGPTRIFVYDTVLNTWTQMSNYAGISTTAGYDSYPAWSPDGTKIAFESQRNSSTASPRFQSYQVYILDAVDASGNLTPESATNVPRQLTNFIGVSTSVLGIADRVRFTADGKHLIFVAKSSDRTYPAGTLYFDIFKCDLTDTDGDKMGDNMVRLTDATALKVPVTNAIPTINNPSQGTVNGPIYFDAGVYPDNGKFHIYAVEDQDNSQGQAAITVNKGLRQITSSNGNEDYPTATADKLAFRTQDPGQFFDNRIGIGNQDIDIVQLAPAPAPGTAPCSVSGVIVADCGQPLAGETVELWTGYNKLIASSTTLADGAYSFASIEPGPYLLKFYSATTTATLAARNATYSTVTRGFQLLPNDNLTIRAFTSLALSPRPIAPVATIVDPTADNPTVSLRWALSANQSVSSTTFTPIGYNVYRAPAEAGPWTKINSTPVPHVAPLQYIDASPGDITHAFYAVTLAGLTETAPAVDPTTAINESALSEVAQATNNLLNNPSFESVDSTTGLPVGWVIMNGRNTGKWGVDTTGTQGVDGASALYMEAISTTDTPSYGQTLLNEDIAYSVPVTLNQPMVQGVFCKMSGIKVANTAYSRTNLQICSGDANPSSYVSYDAATFDTGTLAGPATAAVQNTVWTWLNQGNGYFYPYDFSTYTRFEVLTCTEANEQATIGGRIYFDEAHFQAKRALSVGTIFGRVLDAAGNGVSGVSVTAGGQATLSKSNGVYVLPNVPTGQTTVSISYSGQPTRTITLWNVGGAFITDTTYSSVVPFNGAGGHVYNADGTPASGAAVRMLVGNLTTDGEETEYTATSGADGYFTFDTSAKAINTALKAWVVAGKSGYQSTYVSNQAFAPAGTANFNLTLGTAVPVIEVARTNTPPTIDGVVNTSEWLASSQTALAYRYPGTSAPTVPTKAYAMWDDTNLYIAIVATEPNIPGLVATWSGGDNGGVPVPTIWGDDDVQLFLDPTNSTAIGYFRECWQLGANTNQTSVGYADGTIRTGPAAMTLRYADDIGGLAIANHVDSANGNWSIEAQIPFTGLYGSTQIAVVPPTAGTEWRGMFERSRVQSGESSTTTIIPTASTLAFSRAELWNTLRFVNAVTPTAVKGDLNGDGQVTNADALIALQIAGGLQSLAGRVTQGDVVSDGKVDLLDASRILRKVNGLEPAW